MSLFSEKLKLLLAESGYSIYQISKSSQLDRTTIQRSVAGTRLPGIDFVKKLCNYMEVSPAEKKELLELYTITRIGEKKYRSRQAVKHLLEQMAQLHIYQLQPLAESFQATVSMDLESPCHVFSGEYQVSACIHATLSAARARNADLSVCVPTDCRVVFDCLKELYLESCGSWKVSHLLQLEKSGGAFSRFPRNLEIVTSILPFSFCPQTGYQPSYFYCNAMPSDNISLAMPYYFLTEQELVTLSADLKTAVHYTIPEIISIYQECFCAAMAEARPLLTSIITPMELVTHSFDALQKSGAITYSIEAHPCFLKYYTPEIVERYVRKTIDHRPEFVELVNHYQKEFTQSSNSFTSFFSAEGLQIFSETGIVSDLPPQIVLPVSPEDRMRILHWVRDDIVNDTVCFRAVNSSKFNLSPLVYMTLYTNQSIMTTAYTENYIVSCFLDEPSIGAAFQDFLDSLTESDLVYDKKNTLQLIDDCLLCVAKL